MSPCQVCLKKLCWRELVGPEMIESLDDKRLVYCKNKVGLLA